MYSDVVREARSEQEVYFLLNSYIEAVRFGDPLNLVPEVAKKLPLSDQDYVREQYERLMQLDKAPSNDNAGAVIKEALPIFSAALERLESLSGHHDKPLQGAREAVGLT
jgi:hypothetical protein